MLLTKRGEDEICVWDREEITLGLGTFCGTSSPHSAVAHSDERLLHLVATSPWVRVGVEEAGEALFLVRFEDFGPVRDHQGQAGHDEDDGLLPLQSAQEQTDQENRDVCEGGSQVGLLEDQQ